MTAPLSASTLISDPLFRLGYDDGWQGRDCDVQAHWEQAERQSYLHGYEFALALQDSNQPRLVLARGGLPNSEAAAALTLVLARGNGGFSVGGWGHEI